MDTFNLILTRLFDGLLYPFRGMHPMWGLSAVSILTGIVMVWLFGKVSNQRRIRRLKSKIRGHLLEMWIFRENLRVVFQAQGRTLWTTVKYAACSLQAVVILMIPVVFTMIQLQARYGYQPLSPGDRTLVKILYAQPVALDQMAAKLEVPDGIVVETQPLRRPPNREVCFRIRAEKAGDYELVAHTSNGRVVKKLAVGPSPFPMSPRRSAHWLDRLLYPAEPGLTDDSLASIELHYASRELSLWGVRFHWLWVFFLISIAAGFALKGVFKVEV